MLYAAQTVPAPPGTPSAATVCRQQATHQDENKQLGMWDCFRCLLGCCDSQVRLGKVTQLVDPEGPVGGSQLTSYKCLPRGPLQGGGGGGWGGGGGAGTEAGQGGEGLSGAVNWHTKPPGSFAPCAHSGFSSCNSRKYPGSKVCGTSWEPRQGSGLSCRELRSPWAAKEGLVPPGYLCLAMSGVTACWHGMRLCAPEETRDGLQALKGLTQKVGRCP